MKYQKFLVHHNFECLGTNSKITCPNCLPNVVLMSLYSNEKVTKDYEEVFYCSICNYHYHIKNGKKIAGSSFQFLIQDTTEC